MAEWSVAITSLIYPDDPAIVVPIMDFEGTEVAIRRNGQRTGQSTFSLWNDVLQKMRTDSAIPFGQIEPFGTCLRIAWRDTPLLWGVNTLVGLNAKEQKVTANATDRSLSLAGHFLNEGDAAIDEGNGFDGKLPPDSRGLRLLRDSANLLLAEETANWARLGIKNGTANTDATNAASWVRYQRFMINAWDAMTQIAALQFGPDFDLEPVFNDPLNYAKLNVYDRQGTNRSSTVKLQHAFGGDNLDDFDWQAGGKLITHSIAVSQDGKSRSDVAFNEDSASFYGKYERVDATDFKAGTTALNREAARWVKGYGEPPDAVTIAPLPAASDDPNAKWPIEDFWVGDTISAEMKLGSYYKLIIGRVEEIRIKQADQSGNSAYEVDLVPENVVDDDLTFA